MTNNKKKRPDGRPKNYVKLHYTNDPSDGLYWRVRVRDARTPVRMNGSVFDAMKGEPGLTVGCHLSHCASRNKENFPHKVIPGLTFFIKSRAYIVTTIKNGKPSLAVRYHHSCGKIVDLNDTDITKRYAREHPEISERIFTLRPPPVRRPVATAAVRRSVRKKAITAERKARRDGSRAVAPRGAMRRAYKAGKINKGLLSAMAHDMDAMDLVASV